MIGMGSNASHEASPDWPRIRPRIALVTMPVHAGIPCFIRL